MSEFSQAALVDPLIPKQEARRRRLGCISSEDDEFTNDRDAHYSGNHYGWSDDYCGDENSGDPLGAAAAAAAAVAANLA